MTQNQIAYWNLRETERANKVREAETNRANKAQEQIARTKNDITLNLGQQERAETVRSNLARELENNRTNMSNEEIKRISNVINALDAATRSRQADIAEGNLGVAWANLGELERSHKANESIQVGNLLETNRANIARETENNRTNVAHENIQRFSNATKAAADITSNNTRQQTLEETTRHNAQQEVQDREKYLRDQQLRANELLQTINRDKWTTYTSLINGLPKPRLSYGGTR